MAKRTGIKIRQLAILTAAWISIGAFISLYDFLLLAASDSLVERGSFFTGLIVNTGSGLVGALLGGLVKQERAHERARRLPTSPRDGEHHRMAESTKACG